MGFLADLTEKNTRLPTERGVTCAKAPPRARGRGLLEARCSPAVKSGKQNTDRKPLKKNTVNKPLTRKDRDVFLSRNRDQTLKGFQTTTTPAVATTAAPTLTPTTTTTTTTTAAPTPTPTTTTTATTTLLLLLLLLLLCYYYYYNNKFCNIIWCAASFFRVTRYLLREVVYMQIR